MRIATTIFLLLLVAGFGSFVFFNERGMVSTSEIERRSGLLLDLEPAEIASLEVNTPRCSVVFVRGSNRGGSGAGTWMAHGDLEDRVDPEWIDGLLEAVASLEVITEIGPQVPGEDMAKGVGPVSVGFGRNNVGSIVVKRENGRVDSFEVGAAGALEGTVHLRNAGTTGSVFLVRSPLRDFTHGDLEEIRDRRLWIDDPAEVLRFAYSGRQGQVAFQRGASDEYWRLERPLQTEASDATVQRLLTLLAGIQAEGFPKQFPEAPGSDVAEGEMISFELPGDGAGKEGSSVEEGPARGSLTIRFWREEGSEGAADEGDGGEDDGGEVGGNGSPPRGVYAVCSERATVMAVDPRAWDALDYEIDDFRNRTLARLDPEAISVVRIAASGEQLVDIEKVGERWMLDRNGRGYRANGERVDRLIEMINGAEILDFVSDSASSLAEFGLEEPFLSLTLAGASDSEGETLDFGVTEEAIYARWRGDPFVFRVSAEIVGEIPVEAVKWKHLTVLQFAIFSLRNLRISPGGAPSIELEYDYRNARWRGLRAGVEITDLIDPVRAEMVAAGVGSLVAVDWLVDSAVGFAALRDPELVVDVSLKPPPGSRVAADGGLLDFRISFAPAGASGGDSAYYYGAMKGIPEVFLVRREIVEMIAMPPMKEGGGG